MTGNAQLKKQQM